MNQRRRIGNVLFYVVVLAFFGIILYCMVAMAVKVKNRTSEPSTQNYGEYYLFETTKSQEYLEFLEKLDEEEYEIIDISTSLKVHIDGSDEFYMVTYKKIT